MQGTEYELPPASDGQIAESGQIAATYTMQFLPGSSSQHANCEAELTTKLQAFRTQLLRAAAEGRALADAQNFELNEERLSRNIKHLRKLESLEELLRGGHHRRQQASGMNSTRIRQWLNADPDIGKFLRICDHGAVADKDLNIRCTERTAPHRNLQRRLAPVYYKTAAGMHDTTDKLLLFRVADLTPEERGQIHMIKNEYYWQPDPRKVAGRPLMDCSNAAPGAISLNTETTKESGIERYKRVTLPTFREVLTQWNRQRREAGGLTWGDMWIFKADIAGCFNQIHWIPEVSKLMASCSTARW